ncbi:hypothetical protein CONPUDRAFT_163619 [Coniophora puteana RWD-64-598 SS2]|uniref:Integral membrane protein n=1 Tax=Coniophora puteana (strain RWD-64-598) TaxID=741705 RepID=A0A5M3MZU5_CONPW|nr:uncharacterized protein CONPUDRAFT_163619 [Coniophora puteana RWD-64-598 SS2]EIW84517.1 hypothetical protein CONPUDRAFT_163619 [Coniophora puteana RWD-64-598 SS2]
MNNLEWTSAQQATCTFFHVLAISTTSFRLSYRLYMRRLWLEDACAALALAGDTICLVLVWVFWPYEEPGPSGPSPLLYIAASLPSDVLWLARMSILFSIIRVTNPKSTQRRIAYATAVSFTVFWLVIFAQRMALCAHSYCVSNKLTGILQIVAALLSDVALIALPIWSFGTSKLSQERKITIIAVYIATIVITAAVIFDSIEAILPQGKLALLSMNLKVAYLSSFA